MNLYKNSIYVCMYVLIFKHVFSIMNIDIDTGTDIDIEIKI